MTTAIVTGAAGSLGQAIARRLGADGHSLLLVDLADRVEDVATAFTQDGLTSEACVADLGSAEGAAAVLAAAQALPGEIAVLVNNAGINRDARATKMTDDDFRSVIKVDLAGPLRLCDALEGKLAADGAVINIASRAAYGNFGQTNYVTAKSGLIGLTRALAVRWAPNVRVNAVAPGLIDTPMTQGMPPDVLAKLVARVPADRMGSADEVANVVGFLASSQSSYVTGQVIPVCGGRSVG
jgi:3-oxoacyl-[acyl-carrier protein] reductase